MSTHIISDYDLFNLVAGKGVQFLDLSYDVVPNRDGFALRCVGQNGSLIFFDVFQTDAELVAQLRAELETQMWAAVTGQHPNVDLNWTYKGG